jgi:hypothetical protein
MKVFVVIEEEPYESCDFRGVYRTREAAEDAIEAEMKQWGPHTGEVLLRHFRAAYRIEEWEVTGGNAP